MDSGQHMRNPGRSKQANVLCDSQGPLHDLTYLKTYANSASQYLLCMVEMVRNEHCKLQKHIDNKLSASTNAPRTKGPAASVKYILHRDGGFKRIHLEKSILGFHLASSSTERQRFSSFPKINALFSSVKYISL